MPAERSWQISGPQTLDFDPPVGELHLRVVNGTVNVVGTAGPGARVEVTEVHGPPLVVRHKDGRLVVAYEDLPWRGFLKWLDRKGWDRRAVVSLSVPAGVRLTVGAVGASAVVSNIEGRTDIHGVSGDTTLVGLSGPVRAETVSGAVEAQGLSGSLRFNSVSGHLTVLDGGGALKAESVSGGMTLDLAPREDAGCAEIDLKTISGEVAVRLPRQASTTVRTNTASGTLSNAFDELKTDEQWGAQRLSGTLGSGSGRLKVTTVSGAVALLRRPADLDDAVAPSLSKDV